MHTAGGRWPDPRTYNRIFVIATAMRQAVDMNHARSGFVRIPVIIPGDFQPLGYPWHFPVVLEPYPTTALSGAGGSIPFIVGNSGGLGAIPNLRLPVC